MRKNRTEASNDGVFSDLFGMLVSASAVAVFVLTPTITIAKEIKTNEVVMKNAPSWLTATRVEGVTFRVQQKLEWTTRRFTAHWYSSPAAFAKAHTLGPNARAVTVGVGNQGTVHLGPGVTNATFDETFAHELVHVIVLQKYKGSIPKFLEEGLANHIAKRAKPDYKFLARQPALADVRTLAHPLLGSVDGIRYRYEASQALAEMLDKKCDLENLVRLSVQRKLEDYVETYCEIPDLTAAYRAWIKKQAGS